MVMNPVIQARTERTKWFLKDRFGMFIHWGLYAIPARGEWIRNREKISIEEYQKYFDEFNPTGFNPAEWARIAKDAGMKYAVLTAKHHDGFCLFDSKLTEYKSTNTKSGRDFVREYLDAFRAEGLKVGLYYSLLDWHHEDYPAFEDPFHPMRDNETYKNKSHDFSRYLDYMHGQVKELLTNYGKLDIMWFDFSYGEMSGEKWKAAELVQMIRSIQPHLVIDNRLESNGEYSGSIKSKNPSIYSGDFASPEQIIPPEGVVDEEGLFIPWEACITMNNHWGYHVFDKLFISPKVIIRKLIECVSKNGNLLLNVGPDAKGKLPVECEEILKEVGVWMKLNGDSIYDCGRSQFEKPEWGYYTQKGNTLYAHVYEQAIGPVNLRNLGGKIKKARLLKDGAEIPTVKAGNVKEYAKDGFINFGRPEHSTFPLPDEIDTVVELELVDK